MRSECRVQLVLGLSFRWGFEMDGIRVYILRLLCSGDGRGRSDFFLGCWCMRRLVLSFWKRSEYEAQLLQLNRTTAFMAVKAGTASPYTIFFLSCLGYVIKCSPTHRMRAFGASPRCWRCVVWRELCALHYLLRHVVGTRSAHLWRPFNLVAV